MTIPEVGSFGSAGQAQRVVVDFPGITEVGNKIFRISFILVPYSPLARDFTYFVRLIGIPTHNSEIKERGETRPGEISGVKVHVGRNKLGDDTGSCRNVRTHHRFQPNHLNIQYNIDLVGVLVGAKCMYHAILFLSISGCLDNCLGNVE